MENPKTDRTIAKIIQRCWEDDAFKARFIAQPNAILKEEGVDVPAGLEIKVVQNTENVQYLAIPAKATGQLTDNALDGVVGGAGGTFTTTSKITFLRKLPLTGMGGPGTHDSGDYCIPPPC